MVQSDTSTTTTAFCVLHKAAEIVYRSWITKDVGTSFISLFCSQKQRSIHIINISLVRCTQKFLCYAIFCFLEENGILKHSCSMLVRYTAYIHWGELMNWNITYYNPETIQLVWAWYIIRRLPKLINVFYSVNKLFREKSAPSEEGKLYLNAKKGTKIGRGYLQLPTPWVQKQFMKITAL